LPPPLASPLFPTRRSSDLGPVRADQGDATHQARARLLVQGFSRFMGLGIGAALNVVGWMVLFSGVWQIGLWIVLLSAGIVWIVLDRKSTRLNSSHVAISYA